MLLPKIKFQYRLHCQDIFNVYKFWGTCFQKALARLNSSAW